MKKSVLFCILFFNYLFAVNAGIISADSIKSWIKTTNNSVSIELQNSAFTSKYQYHLSIFQNEKTFLVDTDVKPLFSDGTIKININNLTPKLWSPASPELYQLKLQIKKGKQLLNELNFRIGFRKIESRNGQILLNDYPIFLRGIAINPPGRGIPKELEESREFALDYVKFMKSINVNIIRIPDNENWYKVCDELGMMVFGGNYSAAVNGEHPPKNHDNGVEWYKNTKFQPISTHPSLVIYALTNEVPYSGENAQKWIDFLSYAHNKLKEWDNTRLYIGNAGYGYGQSGDICDLHRYWGWYYASPFTFLNIRDYEKITFPDKIQPLTFTECVGNYTGPDGRYNLTPNHKNPVSQLNWTGHAPQREQQLLADEHQCWTFKEVTELIRRLRRINPESSGVFPFTIMFRNWHTVNNFVEMDPKPVTKQARLSYQPVLLSWENWKPQVYAGSTIQPIAHIINDSEDFSDLKEIKLVVRILDKAFSVLYSDTIAIPDINYYAIHSEKLKIIIPENLFDGIFKLEGIVYSSGNEVSRNSEDLYISGTKIHGNSAVEIPVYDPSGKTFSVLKKLRFKVNNIDINKISNELKLLVIGENAADEVLVSKSKQLREITKNGGRILLLRQNKNHQNFLNDILPVALNFPEMNVDDPAYPPPPRPSKNSFNINPERPEHPLFKGIKRSNLKVWSDYTGWDETQPEFPAIYPVTNGFTLQNKPDKKQVAILANYSVGLEGIALAEIYEGEGSVIISGFDLVNRAQLDPIADQLLINLIEYCSGNENHNIYPLIDSPILWGEFETEKGVLDGVTSGLMLNSKPKLYGSYENLPILLEEDGHMYAGAKWGWNNRAGKQYVPYGRRIFGPYYHRDFGGVPTPLDPENKTGEAFFWCRIPIGINSMKTLVWNPANEALEITIGINDKTISTKSVQPGEYLWLDSPVDTQNSPLKINFKGDRRLVILETHFSK